MAARAFTVSCADHGEMLGERGLPALACMLWMIGKMARDFREALKMPARSDARVRTVADQSSA